MRSEWIFLKKICVQRLTQNEPYDVPMTFFVYWSCDNAECQVCTIASTSTVAIVVDSPNEKCIALRFVGNVE